MHISRRKHLLKAVTGVPRGSSNESDSFAGAMVRLAGVSRSANGTTSKQSARVKSTTTDEQNQGNVLCPMSDKHLQRVTVCVS
jgi:hypothetical protein